MCKSFELMDWFIGYFKVKPSILFLKNVEVLDTVYSKHFLYKFIHKCFRRPYLDNLSLNSFGGVFTVCI